MKVPFDTGDVYGWLTDDRGHVLIRMRGAPEGLYDLSPGGAKRFDWPPHAMLKVAVERGARRFEIGRGFVGCVVLPDKRIWFGYARPDSLHYYDGERWDRLKTPGYVRQLSASPYYGILLKTVMKPYLTYDRGQFVAVDYPHNAKHWLMGPTGYQPFEKKLLERHPELYLPVERDGTTHYMLVKDQMVQSGEDREAEWKRGPELPAHRERNVRALAGGFWSWNGPYRILGRSIVLCRADSTPLRSGAIQSVVDDRAGNLWFRAGSVNGREAVFCKRLDEFKLELRDFPKTVGASYRFEATPQLPGLEVEDFRLFWRFPGGPWRGGETGGGALVRFPADGAYTIELVGMDPQGGTTPQRVTLVVTSKAVRSGTALPLSRPPQ